MAIPYRIDHPPGPDGIWLAPTAAAYLAASFSEAHSRTSAGRCLVLPPDIVARIHAREEEAFHLLVDQAYTPLVQFARGFVDERERAEDIVQEIFATIWEAPERWKPHGNPATYLLGMVRYRALNVLRHATREASWHRRAESDPTVRDPASTPERLLADSDEAHRMARHLRGLEALLRTLTERQRTAYDLRYRQGLTIPEIANLLGITTRSGEQLLSRVVRTIRTRLRAMYQDDVS